MSNMDASLNLNGNIALRIAGSIANLIIQDVFARGDSIRLIGIENITAIERMSETFFTIVEIRDSEQNLFCNMISIYAKPPQGFTIYDAEREQG